MATDVKQSIENMLAAGRGATPRSVGVCLRKCKNRDKQCNECIVRDGKPTNYKEVQK